MNAVAALLDMSGRNSPDMIEVGQAGVRTPAGFRVRSERDQWFLPTEISLDRLILLFRCSNWASRSGWLLPSVRL